MHLLLLFFLYHTPPLSHLFWIWSLSSYHVCVIPMLLQIADWFHGGGGGASLARISVCHKSTGCVWAAFPPQGHIRLWRGNCLCQDTDVPHGCRVQQGGIGVTILQYQGKRMLALFFLKNFVVHISTSKKSKLPFNKGTFYIIYELRFDIFW